jgi:hypothetical protein
MQRAHFARILFRMICADQQAIEYANRLVDEEAAELWSSGPRRVTRLHPKTVSPLVLFAVHAVPDEFSHAARAGTRVRRIAALSRELTASFKPGSHTPGVRA